MLKYLFFAIIYIDIVQAQNLFPNPSFEDINICTEYNSPCSPECIDLNETRRTLIIVDGIEYAQSGMRYISQPIYNSNFVVPNHLETNLICTLKKDKTYLISFYLKRLDNKAFHPLQANFYSQDLSKVVCTFADSIPQIKFETKDKIKAYKWIYFTAIYIAKGDENYFVLGPFENLDNATEVTHAHSLINNGLYYLLDDISIEEFNTHSTYLNYDENLNKLYNYNDRHTIIKEDIPIKTLQFSIDSQIVKSDIIQPDTFVLSSLLFETDSFSINAEIQNNMDSFIASTTLENIDSIVFVGHTDNSGNTYKNKTLSYLRAKTIYDYFNFKTDFIINSRYVGYGDLYPKYPNTLPYFKKLNRRVELIIYKKE